MQVSTRKGVEVTVKNEDRQSSKRQREVSLKVIGPESFNNKKKIRKAAGGSQAAAAQQENKSEIEAEYDACAIENDSVLLGGLLADFDDLVATQSQDVPSCQGQSKEAEEPAVFDGDLDDLFQDDFLADSCTKECANLRQFRTCRILEIDMQRCHTRLSLIDIRDEAEASVECHGFWKAINVSKNNLVSICAKRNGTAGWIVDNDNGFIIVEPHFLVSTTTVVGANFCHRKGILAENFRGLDSLPNVETDDYGMTVGTLVHQVLQKGSGEYAQLATKALTVLLLFPRTYLCETGFSACAAAKTKYRNRLAAKPDMHLQLYSIKPEIK